MPLLSHSVPAQRLNLSTHTHPPSHDHTLTFTIPAPQVPRTLYINSSLPPSDPLASALGRKVARTLPGGAPAQHVYELVLPEQQYLAGASDLAVQLAAGHVQGVYEERLPLALHAALQLGWVIAWLGLVTVLLFVECMSACVG